MERANAPYVAQDRGEVARMIKGMHDSSQTKAGYRFKSRSYNISDGSGKTVDSWSLNEWDYKKGHLPTYARGLFTHSNNGKPEIAVRGYDKFFNVGEVHKTEWDNVRQNTKGPYELSVKENGCIIFIAGLDDNTLIVTSKHSTGLRDNDSANHALRGEQWIDRQLATLGRTRADLARRLRTMNATAVAELCDDEFEEHVLQYKPEDSGLYLHGINLNLPEFATYPSDLLHQFSDEWGFRKVMYIVEPEIDHVKGFLDQVAQTGNYEGRDTEGFVVRCKARDGPGLPWHDWFFKYKFEEPYLMYRQWREVTKAIIAGKPPKYRKHAQITQEYIAYARQALAKNPQIGQDFNKNHGIIAMRDGFLAHKGMRGSDIIRGEEVGHSEGQSPTRDIVLVPIATIGCGKTTVAIALQKLFGWGHEQNDNILGKKGRAQRFATACVNSMTAHPVVIADRNNHQRRERDQIIKDIQHAVPETVFVALHWVHHRGNYDEIKRAMRERVLARGDNHQTIQAGSKGQPEIQGIMDGFMERFEPCDTSKEPDSAFDLVIDLNVASDSIDNLATVIDKLHAEYPNLFKRPSDSEIEAAIADALTGYKPDVKHDLSRQFNGSATQRQQPNNVQAQSQQVHNAAAQKQQGKDAKRKRQSNASDKRARIEYFGIFLPTDRVNSVLDAVFRDLGPDGAAFYNQLKSSQRVQPVFHATLIHRNSTTQHPAYWAMLKDEWQNKQAELQGGMLVDSIDSAKPASDITNIINPEPDVSLGAARVRLEHVVWDGRVMAVAVSLPEAHETGVDSVNERAHVTVGTSSPAVKPFQSNALLARWAGGAQDLASVQIKGSIVLDGVVRAVLARP